jgi:ribosomal protein S18 acetylase RimI-like enzyme
MAEASSMLARAFVANPLHVAAFGPHQLSRNAAFFRLALASMTGSTWVAADGDRILGFVHWVDSSRCQRSLLDKVQMAPALVNGLGVSASWRLASWLSAWATRDPTEPHVHLGPIGVDPAVQGRSVGRRLMERYCEALDLGGQPGYLETDREENVGFYRRFEFEVVGEMAVLGVRNYFMRRAPHVAGRARESV